ncbi:hypothetical protein [Sciscionella marina]|uniref:hypothetical protein n=1 Tax=Sciscionella marina TaxID=508770 RepID=UPI00035E67FE|nr:hypothetical protein [Sciscionella marina]
MRASIRTGAVGLGAAAAIALSGQFGFAATTPSNPLEPGTHVPATMLKLTSCDSIPPDYDRSVAETVYDTAVGRDVDDRVMLSTFETAWVESHVNNLPCGDADSLGVFQQRPSAGWGTPEQVQDPVYATNAYLDQAITNAANNPGWSAGQVAQSVQRSAYPDRYDQNEDKAREIIGAMQS